MVPGAAPWFQSDPSQPNRTKNFLANSGQIDPSGSTQASPNPKVAGSNPGPRYGGKAASKLRKRFYDALDRAETEAGEDDAEEQRDG